MIARFDDVAVVISGGKETKYFSLENALGAAKDGDTVKLLSSYKVETRNGITINKNITLDFNGKNIYQTDLVRSTALVINKGIECKLTNSSSYSGGIESYVYGIKNYGTLTIENVEIEGYVNALINETEAKCILKDGNIHAGAPNYCADLRVKNFMTGAGGVAVSNKGTFIMEDGYIHSLAGRLFGRCIDNIDGEFIMNGGKIKGDCVSFANDAQLTINGGTIDGGRTGVTNLSEGKVIMNNGSIIAETKNQGVFDVYGGDIVAKYYDSINFHGAMKEIDLDNETKKLSIISEETTQLWGDSSDNEHLSSDNFIDVNSADTLTLDDISTVKNVSSDFAKVNQFSANNDLSYLNMNTGNNVLSDSQLNKVTAVFDHL